LAQIVGVANVVASRSDKTEPRIRPRYIELLPTRR
jgi:hypothetical protein